MFPRLNLRAPTPALMFGRALVLCFTACVFAALAGGCIAGEVRDRHANVVDDYLMTPFVNPDQPALDPKRALGPPDGRTLALGIGASVTLRFFREIPDGPGLDLRIYEVGPDGAEARIAVSEDGSDFNELETLASGPTTEYDFSSIGLSSVFFVRVRGADNFGIEAGFDLDAVEALH